MDETRQMESLQAISIAFPPHKNVELLGPIALAYVGDAIHELYIRQYLLSQANHRPHHLHRQATRFVSAKAQAKLIMELLPMLTEEEVNIVKRGRNAHSNNTPKNTDVIVYRLSTAFECLLGYLHYKGRDSRLMELLQKSIQMSIQMEQGGQPNE